MGRTDTDHVRSRLGSVRNAEVRVEQPFAPRTDDDDAFSPEWLTEEHFRATSSLSRFLPARWRAARVDPGRRGVFALAGVGVAIVAIAAVSVARSSPTASPVPPLPVVQTGSSQPLTGGASELELSAAASVPASVPDSLIIVSVVGMVPISGLLTLPAGSRIADALTAAGGPRPGADVLGLNLARKLEDGDQIIVGAAASPPGTAPPLGEQVMVGSSASGEAGATAASTGAPGKTPGTPVNLNTATLAELDSLPGVGPVTAAAILSWRETNGKFVSADQLGEVTGIGPARLEKLRSEVTV